MLSVTARFRAASRLAQVVPESFGFTASRAMGALASWSLREERAVVERNLRRVLGDDVSDAEVRRAVLETFSSYAQYYHESFRLPELSPSAIDDGIRFEGLDYVVESQAKGRGTILGMPHLGGWEWAGFWLTMIRKWHVAAVVEALEPPELFEWFRDLRERLGFTVIPLGDTAGVATVRSLKNNDILVLMSDRYLGGAGVEVEFFGEKTWLPAGAATLALRTGADLVPAAVYFDGKKHIGIALEPISLVRTGRFRADVSRVTQELAHHLEELIKRAPEQWHLLQPNWPSDYEYFGRPSPYPSRDQAD